MKSGMSVSSTCSNGRHAVARIGAPSQWHHTNYSQLLTSSSVVSDVSTGSSAPYQYSSCFFFRPGHVIRRRRPIAKNGGWKSRHLNGRKKRKKEKRLWTFFNLCYNHSLLCVLVPSLPPGRNSDWRASKHPLRPPWSKPGLYGQAGLTHNSIALLASSDMFGFRVHQTNVTDDWEPRYNFAESSPYQKQNFKNIHGKTYLS